MKYIIFAIPFLLVGVVHGNIFTKSAEGKRKKNLTVVAPRDKNGKPDAPVSSAKQDALDRLELNKLPETYLKFDLHFKHTFAKTLEGCVDCNVNDLHNDFQRAYWQLVEDVEEVKNAKKLLGIKGSLKDFSETELGNVYMLAALKNSAEAKKAKDLIGKIINR